MAQDNRHPRAARRVKPRVGPRITPRAEMTPEERRAAQEREVDDNYRAFKAVEDGLSHELDGKYALLREREIIGFYDDAVAAYEAGLTLYPNRRFSMQEVRAKPLDFGWFSHVSPALFTKPAAD